MPYDPSAPLEEQLHASIASSLHNLRPKDDTDEGVYLDCLLLHSPLPTIEQTLQAWAILESYVPHKIRALGISNTSLPVLQAIHEASSIKPSVVQNRFYAQTGYDVPLREFCKQHGITYQSFWTLTGNPRILTSEPVGELANHVGVESAVALYALVMGLGIVVLNGTTNQEHMEKDMRGVREVRDWVAGKHEREWIELSRAFGRLIEGPTGRGL